MADQWVSWRLTAAARWTVNHLTADGGVTTLCGRRVPDRLFDRDGSRHPSADDCRSCQKRAEHHDAALETVMADLRKWKVRFQHLEDKQLGYPFWKRTMEVTAASRKEAVAQAQAMFSPPRYGKFTASVSDS